MKQFKITVEWSKTRLDVCMAQMVPEISRASVQKLCDLEKILVNGKPARSSYKLKVGEVITLDYDVNELTEIPDIDLPILYEDDDCVVINKPLGLLTHSKGAFNPEATVATWLSGRTTDLDGERAGIVHRLDRATSGVMIGAKNQATLAWLQKQFSQRKVKKIYAAIVEGELQPSEAIIDMPIERNPKAPATFRTGANGKPALTHYKVLESDGVHSLLELRPQTGRTHQLRVHLKHIGHPIVGDTFYEGKSAKRLYLHAMSLEITLPNKERKIFYAPLPLAFSEFMRGQQS
ncbi:MAG TPA: RluA family pseudouridine synthase [Candidatus Saccharimonadales bacterium]|nr:RluA family pseudouridine synthase [Candidatus Saccharimonadales bacterium]